MPYQVIRTIWLKDPETASKQIARNPGDLLSQEDLDEIPDRVRERQLRSLVDGGKIKWIDSPEQKLADARQVVEAHDGKEAFKKKIDDTLIKHDLVDSQEPKKRGRPPKK